MKKIVFIALLIKALSVSAQNNNESYCDLLQAVIENKTFQQHYFLCSSKSNKDIVIIDSVSVFKGCNINSPICGRKISMSPTLSKEKDKYQIVVYRFSKINKNTYSINFLAPSDNGGIVLEAKRKKSRIEIKIIQIGVF